MVNVVIHMKDGSSFQLFEVEIEQDMTRLVVHESETEYTVVPVASINYYDVEEISNDVA